MRERRKRGSAPSAAAEAIARDYAAPSLDGAEHSCGGHFVRTTGAQEIAIRGESVTVIADFYRCSGCGEERFDLDQVDRARAAAAETLTRAEGLLLPDEIRALRKGLGLTQEAFESALGLGSKTVVRWESGKVIPGRSAALLLEALRRDPSLMRHFDALARGERPVERIVIFSAQPLRKWQVSQQIELQTSGFTGEFGVVAA